MSALRRLDSCWVYFFQVPLGWHVYISTRVVLGSILLSFFFVRALLWSSLKVGWKCMATSFAWLKASSFFVADALNCNCRWNWNISTTEAFFHMLLGVWWSNDYSVTDQGLPPPDNFLDCITWEENKSFNKREKSFSWDGHLFSL